MVNPQVVNKRISITLSALILLLTVPVHAQKSKQIVNWPPVKREMKPWVRWWWLGSAVDKPNISRLLKEYQKVGLAGVEITPIYGVVGNDTNDISYLSPKWTDILKYTIDEAQKLNMGVDMPTGTGWPFGGPQVTEAEVIDRYSVDSQPISGSVPIKIKPGNGQIIAITAVDEHGETVILTDNRSADGQVNWTPNNRAKWNLYFLRMRPSKMQVKRAAPGGQGLTINPFSLSSLNQYLPRFDSALAALPNGSLRSYFHDSFEYQSNWSPSLLEEFKRRRGYNLIEHLPALYGRGDRETVAQVKTDYRSTIGEMLLENFTEPWTKWAHSKGALSRNQAHGSPGNLLDLYGAVDIPETEVFHSIGDVRISKFASSAAHVMGRNLVSSETGTWQSEHFTEKLSDTKRIIDRLFLGGINHIIYHGTAYSPANAKWPGWLFYASTAFQPGHSIWHDFSTLNDYVSRCQSLLQAGHSANETLVYFPIHDIWMSQPNLFGFTIEGKWIENQPVGTLASFLMEQHTDFDYISDRQLTQAKVIGGKIHTIGNDYKIILLPPTNYLDLATWNQLLKLAKEGANIRFTGGLPKHLSEFTTPRTGIIPQIHAPSENIDKLKQVYASTTYHIGKGTITVLDSKQLDRSALFDLTDFNRLSGEAQYVRRLLPDSQILFVSNQTDHVITESISISKPIDQILLMNPMTGEISRPYEKGLSKTSWGTQFKLDPSESMIVRVMNQPISYPKMQDPDNNMGRPISLLYPWKVKFVEGGPVLPQSYVARNLRSWTEESDPELTRFGGTASFTTQFDNPDLKITDYLLNLGEVCDTAQVFLNGKRIGTLLGPQFKLFLQGVKPKGNVLRIDVTNSSANRIRDMDRRKEIWRIFKEINFVNIDYKPFDASNWTIKPSGLLGPVTMTPLHRTTD